MQGTHGTITGIALVGSRRYITVALDNGCTARLGTSRTFEIGDSVTVAYEAGARYGGWFLRETAA